MKENSRNMDRVELPSLDEVEAEHLQACENPSGRLPCILVVDTSGSMAGEPIEELKRGLRLFFDELSGDLACRYSVEPAIITFSDRARVLVPFGPIAEIDRSVVDSIEARGATAMGAALELTLREIGDRRRYYKQAGLPAYRPSVILLSDGAATDDIERVAARMREPEVAERYSLFPIGVGPQADLAMLARIAQAERPPLRLDGLKFRPLMRWAVDSLRLLTGSRREQSVVLPPTGTWSVRA
jgi:uncharacterized protein YegL